MKLACAGEPHLTYCTNIHPGESWAEIRHNLETYVTAVKRRVRPEGPFGIGLRLSGRAATELSAPGEIEALQEFLADEGLYVFTINGFPHGKFHGARVKEDVYLPDWLDDERLAYSDRLAQILAQLLPDGLEGSVSTVPGAFKPRVHGEQGAQAMADRMLRHAAAAVRLFDRTGKRVALALEPEPFCHLETIAETVSFFERHVFSGVDRFGAWAGLTGGVAGDALRRHLGVCLDACHLAVGFEDLDAALGSLSARAIRIAKFQISAGLEVRPCSSPPEQTFAALRRFADDVYLHQVTERRGPTEGPHELVRFLDLPEALDAASARGELADTWRIHFHVPLFREELGPFHGTQVYLAQLLERIRSTAHAPHLEVETYTWGVLPEEHRSEGIVEAIARELDWVTARLGQS